MKTILHLAERLCAAAALLLLLPVLALIAAAVVLSSGWPILFGQHRVGLHGSTFRLWKFRSMRNLAPGTQVTASGDPRITRAGAFLRKFKLDELPQLWNIVLGEMSLIGPRPEVPRYVAAEDPRWRAVLSVRPGLTDLATLVYRNEEEILGAAGDPEQCYRERVLPDKLALNIEYIRRRTWLIDLRLLALTARYSLAPQGFKREEIPGRVLGTNIQ